MVGVDSAKSVSTIDQRTGVLDPAAGASGMYWSWNAGYIFMKIEGTSPQAPLDPNLGERHFEYHTGLFGGFSSPTLNNLKTIHLHSHEPAMVRRDANAPHFHLYVDALEIFTNPVTISIAEHPASHADPFSATIANNYVNMFVLDHVHNP
ncbi:MAG: hypothetical protein IPL65_08080 [Lewinellaceae bacterium]|nr:hypothetical protein [Lewinellaceae bacterium]